MSENLNIDYGPLSGLIGIWIGDKGKDLAPEPEGIENNPYYETITFTGIGDVTNAELQILAAVHYRQIVQKKSNDKVFHDETGYWMWDSKEKIVMQSLTIPRGVSVLAGGNYDANKGNDGKIILEVTAALNDEHWKIIQSPFMQKNAKTTQFSHQIIVGNGNLSYSETTIVEIYGNTFEHIDCNELIRQ